MRERRWSSCLAELLLSLLAASGSGSAAAAAAAAGTDAAAPTVLLHLSDIHYSVNVHKYWAAFGDREGDAALWATELVPRLGPPAAVLVTGDITDSKTARGDGLQQEAEWLAYSRLLANLSVAGVPLERTWDVPGNHDTFNMGPRNGPKDYFLKHSAEGPRRRSPQQRVFVHALQGAAEAAEGGQRCPAAWLVGLDPTPDPGLRSPTNFAGLAVPALLTEVHAALLAIREQHPAGCGEPLILAHCHYPLSTIDSSPMHGAGPTGALAHASWPARAMQGLTKLLASHNVSAVFSGHLHSSFGERLHRVHATPAGGRMAELETAAWKDDRRFRLVGLDGGALTFLDLFFHTSHAPRMPRRSDAAAMQDAGWQEAYAARGWAVTALDASAAVVDHIAMITSPPDGRYSPLGPPKLDVAAPRPALQQGSEAGEDASATAGKGGDSEAAEAAAQGWVRALVFDLGGGDGGGSAAGSAGGDSSAGQLEAELAGYLPGGAQLFRRPMQQLPAGGGGGGASGASGPLLFAAQGETTVSCVGSAGDPHQHCLPPADLAYIQVSVTGPSGRTSRSLRQPVALRCAPLAASHQRCWVAAVEGEPLPLGVTFLEWLGLAFNWPVLVHRLFLLVWVFQVGAMLVAPRLLGRAVLPRIAASPLLQCHATGGHPASTPHGSASAGAGGAVAAAARVVLSHLLWPVAALFLCASVTEVWTALLGYSLYLLVGPWLLYTALSGRPLAMLFHYGVMLPGVASAPAGADSSGSGDAGSSGGWHFHGTPDTMFVSLAHSLMCLLPATLWVACVVGRRLQLQPYTQRAVSRSSSSSDSSTEGRRRMESGGASSTSLRGGSGAAAAPTCSRFSFSLPQLVALAGIAAFNLAAIYLKAYLLMGAAAVLASPGLAWTLPLALLLVVAWGGPRRPSGAAAKGE